MSSSPKTPTAMTGCGGSARRSRAGCVHCARGRRCRRSPWRHSSSASGTSAPTCCSTRSGASCCRRPHDGRHERHLRRRRRFREILTRPGQTAQGGRRRPRDRVRARHRDRRRDVAGALGRALAVPVGRRAADRADPGDRAADRLLVGLRLPQPRARVRPDLAVPDDHEHAVRPAQRAAGPARSLLAAPREPLDAAREARVPGSAAGHLRRPADLCAGSR